MNEEDAAYLEAALSGAKATLEDAQAEVAYVCRQALDLGKALRDAERADGRDSATFQRLLAECFEARDRVHAAQRKWMLKGFDVYVAHDRNGYPILVDKACRKNIVGF